MADVLWHNNTDGRAGIWSIDGATGTESTQTTLTSRPSEEWQVVNPVSNDVDIFTGETAVADTFELGNTVQSFYDEILDDDYGLIVGFASGDGDKVQLSGSSADYSLQENVAGLPAGTAIYLTTTPVDELVGVVKDVSGLSLAGSEFSFV